MSGIRHARRARRVRARHGDLDRALSRDDARRTRAASPALVEAGGLKAEAFPDLRPAQWSKLIFNATVNGVAALTDLPHDFHFAETEEPSDLGSSRPRAVDEGKAVAAAAGVELHDDPWEMNVLATQRGHRHFPSMLDDVEARRPTEVELINGALVREAEQHGVDGARSRRRSIGSSRRGRRATRSEDLRRRLWGGRVAVRGDAVAARRRRGLGVRPRRAARRGDQPRRPAALGRGRARRAPARDERRGRAAAVRLRDRRDEGMHTEPAIAATAHAFAEGAWRPSRTAPATRRRSPGTSSEVIRGTTFPAGHIVEPGHVRLGHEGRHAHRPVRASPAPMPKVERSPTRARAAGCRRTRSRTRAARSGAS